MYRVDLLEGNLARLCNSLEGGRAAVIVSVEDGSAHSSQVAAMPCTLVGLGERTLARLGLGEGGIGRLMVEGDHGSMIVVPVSDEASIAVLLEKEARIAAVLYAVKGAAEEIRVILEGNAS